MIKPLTRSTSIGSSFNKGLQIYKENFGLIILSCIVAMLISGISCGICVGPMVCGFIGLVLALIRNQNPKPAFGDLFKGFQKFLPALVCVLLILIPLAIIHLPCIMPILAILGSPVFLAVDIIIASPTLFWALSLVQDQDASIGDALITPLKRLGDKRQWSFILVNLVAVLLGMVGVIACFIGIFFTIPLAICMIVAAYEEVCEAPAQTDDTPAESSESSAQ